MRGAGKRDRPLFIKLNNKFRLNPPRTGPLFGACVVWSRPGLSFFLDNIQLNKKDEEGLKKF